MISNQTCQVREGVAVDIVNWSDEDDSTEPKTLKRTVVVLAFEGWFDAAGSATAAVDWLAEHFSAQPLAVIDPDPFFNFQEERPVTRIDESGGRVIDWPSTEFTAMTTDADHDIVLLSGVEPHLRWETFSRAIVDVAKATNCELMITLGAMVDMVPHTRPAMVKASSTSPELAKRLGLDPPSYQGPTGLIGVLHGVLDDAEIPVISLRVGVPHYVSGAPNPKGSLALLQRMQQVTGMDLDAGGLIESAREWEARVDEAVADDEDISTYVRQIEAQLDDQLARKAESFDDIGDEVERFLRERRDDE